MMKIDLENPNRFGGMDRLREIAHTQPTPFYLYDYGAIAERIRAVKSRLPGIRLYYAVKANPNPELLRWMSGQVDGADISSGGELLLALRSGFDPNRMSFAGPGKTDAEIESSVMKSIGSISVESENELARIEKIAERIGKTIRTLLRVNPEPVFRGFAIKMGGRSSAFGVDEERISELLPRFVRSRQVRLAGIHVYAGTQCLEVETLIANVRHTLAIARSILESGTPLETVNLGGGFGVPYHEGQTALDLDAACAGILAECKAFLQTFFDTDIIIELGRYLTAEAGVYVARVEDVKTSRGKTYCVLDGGMNHHLAASGNFGQVIRKAFRMANLCRTDREPALCRVVGPLCTSIDFLGEVMLAKPEVGDRIAIFDSGAYGYSASPLGFLSHPTPLELAMDESGEIKVIRQSTIPGLGGTT